MLAGFVALLLTLSTSEAQNSTMRSYWSGDDYPSESFKNNEQGKVTFELEVGKDGLNRADSSGWILGLARS